jgi:hypothetical protein
MPAVTGISRRRSYEPVLTGGLTPSWGRTRGKRLKPRYAMHWTAAPAAAGCFSAIRRLQGLSHRQPVRGALRTKPPLWRIFACSGDANVRFPRSRGLLVTVHDLLALRSHVAPQFGDADDHLGVLKRRLRPAYRAWLNALHPEGHTVTINRLDTVKLSGSQRKIAANFEPD